MVRHEGVGGSEGWHSSLQWEMWQNLKRINKQGVKVIYRTTTTTATNS